MAINHPEKLGNKYTLLNLIGTGGMAEVFKGKLSGAEGFEKLVVLKKLLSQLAQDSEIVAHFISEAKLAALLQHENIAQIYDFGELDGSYFIAMEYLFGKDLQSVMQRAKELNDPMGVEQALYIVAKVCEGMEYAHSLRDFQQQPLHIIHRDLSPHNIFITYEGRVKIIDFGIARAELFDNRTQAGVAKGKLSYMSPEQLAAERIDKRSDIFAIGILLYEMLSGKRMYSGDTATMIRKCMYVDYDKLQVVCPGLHPAIYEILDKALEKDVGRRYQSCAHMQADVEESLFNINKRPNAHLLESYIGRLFAGELAAEKRGLSQYLTPAIDTTSRTVLVSSASQKILAHGSAALKVSSLEQPELGPLSGRFSQSTEGLSDALPTRRSRRVKLFLVGSLCAIVVVILAFILEFGRNWDIGEPLPPGEPRVVSIPLKEQLRSKVPSEPATPPEPAPVPAMEQPDIARKILDQAGNIVSQNRPEPYELETAQRLYRQVQEMEPNNKEALAGLDRIREHYRAATEEALKVSNFPQVKNHISKSMFQAPKDGRFSLLQESFEVKRQTIINNLAEKADETMQSNRLTTPADDNAYHYFSKMLELDPQNDEAQNGITRITDKYADLAEEAFRNLKTASAREYVLEGLAINPHHKQLLLLQRDLTIAELAQKAEEAVQKNHMITPADDNAYQYFSEILQLDPENITAQNGITRIADRYADLAEDAYRNRRIPSAREYVQQGLTISPHHKQLLELQRDLTRSKPGIFLKSIEKSFLFMFQ
ncbi:MAG: protein kinase [Proteobacteria bacterium]|nr:protein kinase [Pseudomonadota bacterium]